MSLSVFQSKYKHYYTRHTREAPLISLLIIGDHRQYYHHYTIATDNNNNNINNNSWDYVYGTAIMTQVITTYESSPGSSDECRSAPGGPAAAECRSS